AGTIPLAVGLAVAVAADAALGVIDQGDVDSPFVRLLLDLAIEVLRTAEEVAAGHPVALLAFAEDDGVEDVAVERLHVDGAAAGLRQVVQAPPRLERPGLERLRQRRRGRERGLAVEAEAGLVALRGTMQFRMELGGAVVERGREVPLGVRLRRLRLV